jgi:two-component system response regulator AtoC
MTQVLSVLVVDDEESLGLAIVRGLTRLGYKAVYAPSASAALEKLQSERFDVLLTDLYMPADSGLSLLEFLQKSHLVRVSFVMSAAFTVETAVTAMKLGAASVFEKPFDVERVHEAITCRLQDPATAPSEPSTDDGLDAWRKQFAPKIVGSDPALLQMLRSMMRVSDVDSSVLILGESGTGKELVARALHAAGRRKAGPFIPLNCAAIAENLVESELFGYAKGAFTGAHTARLGRFAAANKGTIFLDEIGEMDLGMQAKLLRVTQEREFTPVGDTTPQKTNVRMIAATNRDLRQHVQDGNFREDLFFRLSVIVIKLPPLRARKSDLPLLSANIIKRVNEETGRTVTGIDDEAMAMFMAHAWPGNVRELENMLEQLVVTTASGKIGVKQLKEMDFQATAPRGGERAPETYEPASEESLDLKAELDRVETSIIQRALKATGGNQKRAAELLKVNRTTLIEKLRRIQARQS